ncbi:MAG: phosphoserine phosphatase SerB [Actinomycetota bacterium]
MSGTFLVVISGEDEPGITTSVLRGLQANDIIIDVEQIRTDGMLTLHFVLESKTGIESSALMALLKMQLQAFNVDISVHNITTRSPTMSESQLVVTLMSQKLLAHDFLTISSTISSSGANIDTIRRISHYPVTALELHVSKGNLQQLRTKLGFVANEQHIDVAVQAGSLQRRGQHLIVLDVDSTLIHQEVIDLLGKEAGVEDEISRITERAMRGELDFADSLQQRVALLRGLDAHLLSGLREKITLAPGAKTLCRVLKYLDYRIALVSGGFSFIVSELADELHVDAFRSNTLEVQDGVLTGGLVGPIIDRESKAQSLKELAGEFGIPLERTIAVGDGANDIDMLNTAGLGIAFNAKPLVRKQADTSLNVPYLDSLLYLLGITRSEIEQVNLELGASSFPSLDTN